MSDERRAPATYGVLVGTIRDGREEPGRSPHYDIWVEGNGDFRVAVNVRSQTGSDVFAFLTDNYTNATRRDLPSLAGGPKGFQPLATGAGGQGLDLLRDNLFDLSAMVQIPPDGPGATLAPDFDARINAAKTDSNAVLLAFGDFYQDGGSDTVFGFSPEKGVHDIHMNQGNSGSFAHDNRVNGDGALFIRYSSGSTFAFFARFTTQLLTTDPRTGNPVSDSAGPSSRTTGVAAPHPAKRRATPR